MLDTKDFDTRFKQLTSGLPRADAFQLKMEIKRLGKPCLKAIDLRGKVDGKCEAIEIDGRTHYLDEVAKNTLSELLITYNGKITEAVYDAMQNTPNNFRVLRRKEEEDKKHSVLQNLAGHKTVISKPAGEPERSSSRSKDSCYMTRFLAFGNYHRRKEERMLYVTKVLVCKDAEQHSASSLDISANGIKLKLAAQVVPFAVGDQVRLKLRQLRDEFSFQHHDNIRFKVVSHVKSDRSECVYGLELIPHEDHFEYQQVVTNLIAGHKLRYKINTTNVEDALLQRAYEYQSIATTAALPLFCQQHDGALSPRYTLLNSKTESIMSFFTLDGRNLLESVFTGQRLAPFLSKSKLQKCVLFACKIKTETGARLFAAFDFELRDDLLAMLFHYGRSSQAEFHQFAIEISAIDGSQHNIASVLPDDLSKEVRLRNAPLAPKIEKLLQPINCLVSIIDVTQTNWHGWDKVAGDYRKLLKYVVDRVVQPQLQMISREFVDRRLEPRYCTKSNALLKLQQQDIAAQTIDFSLKGIRLRCNEPVDLKTGNVVHLELTQFQGMTKVFKLKNLPYEVINLIHEGKQLHLRAIPNNKGQHVASLFFRELIRANSDKLKSNDIADMQDLTTGLTNLLIRYQTQVASFIETDQENHLRTSVMMANNVTHPNFDYCPTTEVEPIGTCVDLSNVITQRRLSLLLDKMKRRSQQHYMDLIFVIKSKDDVVVRHDEEFKNVQLMRVFIEHARKSEHKVIVLRVLTSPVFRYNPEFLKLELQYLRRHAPHRADHILKQISSIKGVSHTLDVTDAFMAPLRQMSEAEIQQSLAAQTAS